MPVASNAPACEIEGWMGQVFVSNVQTTDLYVLFIGVGILVDVANPNLCLPQ
jgi:hypothetical protein